MWRWWGDGGSRGRARVPTNIDRHKEGMVGFFISRPKQEQKHVFEFHTTGSHHGHIAESSVYVKIHFIGEKFRFSKNGRLYWRFPCFNSQQTLMRINRMLWN